MTSTQARREYRRLVDQLDQRQARLLVLEDELDALDGAAELREEIDGLRAAIETDQAAIKPCVRVLGTQTSDRFLVKVTPSTTVVWDVERLKELLPDEWKELEAGGRPLVKTVHEIDSAVLQQLIDTGELAEELLGEVCKRETQTPRVSFKLLIPGEG